MTKTQKIWDYLRLGYSITNAEAARMFDEYRLSDVILRLRKNGHIIECEMVEKKDGSGKYGRYRLVKENG